jgi:hypothetical protein
MKRQETNLVMAGLVPAISVTKTAPSKRDHRDKSGDDELT